MLYVIRRQHIRTPESVKKRGFTDCCSTAAVQQYPAPKRKRQGLKEKQDSYCTVLLYRSTEGVYAHHGGRNMFNNEIECDTKYHQYEVSSCDKTEIKIVILCTLRPTAVVTLSPGEVRVRGGGQPSQQKS